MKVLKEIGINLYELLVEDGSIAIGTIAAILIAGLWTHLVPFRADVTSGVGEAGGWTLFALLMVLLVVNLYVAGTAAARKREAE